MNIGHIKFKWPGENIDKPVEGLEILVLFGRYDGFLDEVIAGNINGVNAIHGSLFFSSSP